MRSDNLSVSGTAGQIPGIVLDDVEDMQVVYGQPAGANFTYVPAGSAVWATVQVVRVCLMLRALADSDARATGSQQQTYVDCQGASQDGSGWLSAPGHDNDLRFAQQASLGAGL